jgi:hypothetical protein
LIIFDIFFFLAVSLVLLFYEYILVNVCSFVVPIATSHNNSNNNNNNNNNSNNNAATLVKTEPMTVEPVSDPLTRLITEVTAKQQRIEQARDHVLQLMRQVRDKQGGESCLASIEKGLCCLLFDSFVSPLFPSIVA